MKKITTLLMILATASIAQAGGGGGSRPVDSGTLRECTGTGGNVEKVILYHTDGGSFQQDTYIDISITDLSLSYFFHVAEGINDQVFTGDYAENDVSILDPTEAIGFRSSGVSGNTQTRIEKIGNDTYSVEGALKVTRTKNAPVDGPDFVVSGTVTCN